MHAGKRILAVLLSATVLFTAPSTLGFSTVTALNDEKLTGVDKNLLADVDTSVNSKKPLQISGASVDVVESQVSKVEKNTSNPTIAGELINEITHQPTYDEALRTVLDSYYTNNDQKSITALEKVVDTRGNEIITNYSNAQKQREQSPKELGFMSGEVLAVTKQGVKSEEISALLENERMWVESVISYGNNQQLAKIRIPLEYTVEQAIDILEDNPYIDFIQKDNIYTTQDMIAEDFADDSMIGMQYYLEQINDIGCWDTFDTIDHEKIKVAVIDTGVDINHEDLKNVINKDLSVRVTADGAIAPLKGDNGTHGTHVSGIVAAQANNGIGIAGVGSVADNSAIDLIGIGCDTGDGGSFTTICVYRAIRYAVENGVRVINLSLGGLFDEDNMFQEAVTLAVNSGCVVVCASGNAYSTDYFYPSDCDGVISVIALEDNGIEKADFSNYGGKDQKVSVAGVDAYSTIPNNEYEAYSGTSMASPIVTAIAAMVLSANPKLTVEQVKSIIYSTCTDLGETGYDIYFGYGRVNAYEAVQKALNEDFTYPESLSLSNSKIELYKGETATLKSTVTPNTAENKVTYFSKNEAICTVSQEGVIVAKSTGTTEIVVATTNGILKSCIVTVADYGTATLDTPIAEDIQTGQTTASTITWNTVENADYYQIYSALTEDGEYSYIGSTYDTQFTVDVGKTMYARPAELVSFYKIKAVSNSKDISDSDLSDTIVYIYVGQNPYLTIDLIWDYGQGRGFIVHWSAITSSHLYRSSTSDPEPKLLATFGTDSTLNYYYDNDVVHGETYTYTLKLFTEYNGVKYGDVSQSATSVYWNDDPVDPSYAIPHIRSVIYENGEITVCRDGGLGEAPINCVYISDDNGKSWYEVERIISGFGEPLTSMLEFDFKPNTTYMIKCKNRCSSFSGTYKTSSEYSSTVYVTTPKELPAPKLAAHYDGAYVNLSWNNCGDSGYYTLYRRSNLEGEWKAIGSRRLKDNYYSDFRGGDDKLYFYKVVYTDPNNKATFIADSNIITESVSSQSPDSNIEVVRAGTSKKLLGGALISPVEDVVYSENMTAPKVTVTYRNTTLVEGIDYSVANVNYNSIGRASVVIYGMNDFIGEKAVYYNVLPPVSKSFDVSYVDYDGSVISKQTISKGENAIEPFPPKRTGYTFTGWSSNNKNIQSDTTIKATYVKKQNQKYTVKFVDRENNLISKATVEKGKSATPPTPPTLTGYKFDKWVGDYTNITSNTTVKAEYKATKFESGLGTEARPYIITNKEQLDYMSYVVRTYGGSYLTAYYELNNDIVYNDVTNFNNWGLNKITGENVAPSNNWIPIGTYNSGGTVNRFSGSFNGNGHQIAGLFCDTKQQYTGLFGKIESATIKNVGIYLGYFNSSEGFCGGLVGAVYGNTTGDNFIEGCYVKECYITGKENVGGLIGGFVSYFSHSYTDIRNCYAKHCVLYATTVSPAGGFIGYVSSCGDDLYVGNCYSYCDVSVVNYNAEKSGNFIGHISADGRANPVFLNCYTWWRNYINYCGKVEPDYQWDQLTLDIEELSVEKQFNSSSYTGFDLYIPNQYPDDTDYMWIDNSDKEDTPSLYFEKGRYAAAFYVGEELYSYQLLREGDTIIVPDTPNREGSTFTGWENVPNNMPAESLDFIGEFTENVYTISYYLNGSLYEVEEYSYGDIIAPPTINTTDKFSTGWLQLPASMIDKDMEVYAYTGVYGDATSDRKTSIADALKVMKTIVGTMKLTDKEKALCDCNGDGKITVADALAIQKYVLTNR